MMEESEVTQARMNAWPVLSVLGPVSHILQIMPYRAEEASPTSVGSELLAVGSEMKRARLGVTQMA